LIGWAVGWLVERVASLLHDGGMCVTVDHGVEFSRMRELASSLVRSFWGRRRW